MLRANTGVREIKHNVFESSENNRVFFFFSLLEARSGVSLTLYVQILLYFFHDHDILRNPSNVNIAGGMYYRYFCFFQITIKRYEENDINFMWHVCDMLLRSVHTFAAELNGVLILKAHSPPLHRIPVSFFNTSRHSIGSRFKIEFICFLLVGCAVALIDTGLKLRNMSTAGI